MPHMTLIGCIHTNHEANKSKRKRAENLLLCMRILYILVVDLISVINTYDMHFNYYMLFSFGHGQSDSDCIGQCLIYVQQNNISLAFNGSVEKCALLE